MRLAPHILRVLAEKALEGHCRSAEIYLDFVRRVLTDERVLKAFHEAEKPIGMCCIAPAIAARVFGTKAGGSGCTVTIGSDADTAKAIETMGSTHSDQPVTDACVDNANRLVTAPAYMFGDAPIHEVHEGSGQMIERTLELAGAGSTA